MSASIEHVLARHAPTLMALEGVTAVAEGRTEEGLPCLKVYVRQEDVPRRKIPASIEGFAVVLCVSGEIGPRRD